MFFSLPKRQSKNIKITKYTRASVYAIVAEDLPSCQFVSTGFTGHTADRALLLSSLLTHVHGSKGLGCALIHVREKGRAAASCRIYAASVSRYIKLVGISCVVLYEICCYHVRSSFPIFPRNFSSRYPGIWKLKSSTTGILAFANTYAAEAKRTIYYAKRRESEKDVFLYRKIHALQQVCHKDTLLAYWDNWDQPLCSFDLWAFNG